MEQIITLRSKIKVDRRKGSTRGPTLTSHFHALGLRKNDRFEPCPTCVDWNTIFECNADTVPSRLLFWRPASQTMLKHFHPMITDIPGGIVQIAAIDAMHTFCLGIFQQLVASCFWAILNTESYGAERASKDRHDLHQANLQHLEKDLHNYYKNCGKGMSKYSLNRLEQLGSLDAPLLHAKAAETLGLVRFLAAYMPTLATVPQHEDWGKAANDLVGLWTCLEDNPVDMNEE
eukprot:5025876-Amphidinium_carterae.1